MGFLAILNAYTMRVCLSITITEMAYPIHVNYTDDSCPYNTTDNKNENDAKDAQRYDWDEHTQVCERYFAQI